MRLSADCVEKSNKILRSTRALVLSSKDVSASINYNITQLEIIKYLSQLPFLFNKVDYHDLFGVEIDIILSTFKYKPSYLYPKPEKDIQVIQGVVDLLLSYDNSLGVVEKAFLSIQQTDIISPQDRQNLIGLGMAFRGEEPLDYNHIPLLFEGKLLYSQVNAERLEVTPEEVVVIDPNTDENIISKVDYHNRRFGKPDSDEKLSLNRSSGVKRTSQENLSLADMLKQLMVNNIAKHGNDFTLSEMLLSAKILKEVQRIERVSFGLSGEPKNSVDEHYDSVGTSKEIREKLRGLSGEQIQQLAKIAEEIKRNGER